MWGTDDKCGFISETRYGRGQIGGNLCKLTYHIEKLSSTLDNKTFLEIGTWNGLGSTKCFVDMLNERDDDYIFYSLECNKDKSDYAKKLYNHLYPKINILNEVLWNEEPENFYDIFPEAKEDKIYKQWNTIDITNMKRCSVFLDRTDLPEIFDVILLDGGEFTTYFEYKLLHNKCKYLLLDDTNTKKCALIIKDIKENLDKWKILVEDTKSRNGFYDL